MWWRCSGPAAEAGILGACSILRALSGPAPPPMASNAPASHDRIPPRALWLLAVITLVWGTNWSLFPVVVREVSVWTFRAVGVFIAGITLLAVARARGLSLDIPRKHWVTVGLATACYLLLWNIASTCGDHDPLGPGRGAGFHDA